MPVGDALPQIESDPRFKVVIGSTEGETVLSTNNKKEPFDKLEVRQAIAHALNREEIIQGVPPGLGVPIGSHFAPHHPAYIDLTGTYPYDPEKAKELLAQAGLPTASRRRSSCRPPATRVMAARSSPRSCARSASTSRSFRLNGPTG
jgi:peptide/nickel transport system substrate-binding protein